MSDLTPDPQSPRPEVNGSAEAGAEADAATAQAPRQHEPAGPTPLGVPRAPTGHTAVDVLMERLADVDHLTADGHLEVYEDVHRGLRSTLTALDARQGPPAPVTPASPPSYDHRS
ncbi:hypothetical protein ACWEFL_23630 [Streptomyces sp. NPDC004838]